MNKQELIKKYKRLEGVWDAEGAEIARRIFLLDLYQLDEPEKVTIPQSVVDWIEHFKKCSGTLYGSTAPYSYYGRAITDGFEGDVIEVLRWIRDNSEVYARAWLDGYTVEEEKKYKITLLNRNDGDLYLVNQNADLADKYGHFSPVVLLFTKCTNFSKKCYELTKKDVVSYDFGWVFDCPGIKIEEVTE